MRTCEAQDADVIIDGKPYRLEFLRDLSLIEDRLSGKKGVRFPNLQNTRLRLKARDAERRAKKREERHVHQKSRN